MNLKITSLIVLFTFFTAVGQETYQVTGKLIASDSETAVSFANAVLLQDGEVVKGSSSETTGTFLIENITAGKYTLNISFLGYKTYNKTMEVRSNLNLGTIVLQKDMEALDGVTITHKKPSLKREIDRLVFNIQGTPLTEENTWEVLRRTPGVIVINNTLSVKNGSPTVYINDRKVHLSSSEIYQLLEGTPAETIKSVEVITNPPARYDAQGGTILNIVMEKNLIVGYHGSVYGNFTQGVFPRYNGGINQFYKRGKFNIFGNYNYTHNKLNRDNDEEINYLDNATTTSVWNSLINRNERSNQHNFSLNVDYEFDAKNTVRFSGSFLYLPYWKRDTETNSVIDDQTAANEDFSLQAINKFNQDKHNLGLNLDYVHKFEKEGEQLSANVHYTDYDKANDQSVATDYTVVANPNFSTAFTTHANQRTNILSGQVDYELPISETANFEAGAKVANIDTKSNLQQFNIINDISTLDVDNSDIFDYDEFIYAAYVSYAKSWEDWSIKVGFRGEQTELRGNSVSTNQVNTQNYFELFPTAYISHKVSEKVNVYADFSRRIQRPSFDDLNPFRFNFTDFSFAAGNPRLQPAIRNMYKIGVEINDTFFIEAYYAYNKSAIFELTLQDNDSDILQYLASNIEKNVDYGLDFITYFPVSDTWDVSFVSSVFNMSDTFTLGDNVQTTQSKWSLYTTLDNNFTFLKDKSLTANLSILYVSDNIQGLSEVSGTNLVALSLRKTLWNKKATLSLTLSDILNGQEFTNTTRFVNQNSRYFSNYDTQTIRVGLRYNFGNTKLQTNQRTKSSAEQERLKD
ncbi:outer membrane protein beta-barrel family protein [Kordia sp. SMS9]|uniref:outer membrane beta-barrel family protein n=1 Tax=Kordia sp. SMS9 TaxID=2282170 RepID=UPI000E0DCCFE|nr:outer membrane beta-barrel family protein [Kordia sp. SMS9]AXG68877.1 outer membrane protein beta-barrel family protein [Kordia sp. SMS9]